MNSAINQIRIQAYLHDVQCRLFSFLHFDPAANADVAALAAVAGVAVTVTITGTSLDKQGGSRQQAFRVYVNCTSNEITKEIDVGTV